MDQDNLTVFICPWCGKDDVLCFKKHVSGKLQPKFEFLYLGFCCEYYPHENPPVESALRKMNITRLNLPKAYRSDTEEVLREKKRLSGKLRHRLKTVED